MASNVGVSGLGLIEPTDFEFSTIPVRALSSAGTPYKRELAYGVPRIPDQMSDAVFYLYPTVEAAKRGDRFGGSGFFFGVPLIKDRWLGFAVTNWHVAVQGGNSVIRINRLDGTTDIFPTDPAEWHFSPRSYDLAILPIDLDNQKHKFSFIGSNSIATDEEIQKRSIGIGDDVFMIGRFVDHDGGDLNRPAARFGNISIMSQPVAQNSGATLPSHILDVHSRTGYSGSPVFVYRTPGSDFTETDFIIGGPKSRFVLLLGIHWGQFPEKWEIKPGTGTTNTHAVPVSGNERYIEGMSGMTLAVPVSALMDLLETPKMKTLIEQVNSNIRAAFPDSPALEVATSTEPKSDNPSHKEDFTRLLGAAAKSNKPAS